MKKIIIIFLAFCFSCKPTIQNDIQTLDKIFELNKFEITIIEWGCFGGSSENFLLTKKEGFYKLKSKRTKKSHHINYSGIDSLKNYLSSRIGEKHYGRCTNSTYIRVGTLQNSVDYEHSFCSGENATLLIDILNYYDLIYEEN